MKHVSEHAGSSLLERVRRAAEHDRAQKEWARAHPEEARRLSEERAQAQQRQREAARQAHEAEQMAAMPGFLKGCGVLRRELELLVKGVESRPAVEAAEKFWASDASFLLLCGPPGQGKTIAAVALMAKCRLDVYLPDLGQVWTWPSGISQRPRYELAGTLAQQSHYGEEAAEARRSCVQARLLVVDELGAEMMTEAWLARFEDVVNQRYRARRRTVLVTNLSQTNFKQRYGERIARRIREDGVVWRPPHLQPVGAGERREGGAT